MFEFFCELAKAKVAAAYVGESERCKVASADFGRRPRSRSLPMLHCADLVPTIGAHNRSVFASDQMLPSSRVVTKASYDVENISTTAS